MKHEFEDILELSRIRLAAYAQSMWSGYETPSHVLKLCNALEDIECGNIDRLIVTMPPRHSKSMNVAQFFPAWFLGKNPSKQIIYSSYSQNQATKFGRLVRNQLADPLFKKIFPNCNISEDSQAKHEFNTIEGGTYNAVGRGGSITGKGADLLILDDMFKDNKEADSKYIREQIKDWYRSVASTRLQKDGSVVLCGTRWHEDDNIGWAINELTDQNWMVINFPARDEDAKPLWPEMFGDSALRDIEKTLGSYFWNALYMGRPSAREGNIFKRNKWQFYQVLPPRFDMMIQSWDSSFKEGNNTSYVVGQVWGKVGPDIYLIDQVRKKMGFVDTIDAISRLVKRYPKTYKKLIEDKANGSAIIDVLKRKFSGIFPITPDGSKESRAQAVSYLQESGNIYLPHPKMKLWVNDFLDECADFPNAQNDDQVDAMSQALTYLQKGIDAVERMRLLVGDFYK